jgi:hypothetical protein
MRVQRPYTGTAGGIESAVRMVARLQGSGHRPAWVVSDEVDGGNSKLRGDLEMRGTGYPSRWPARTKSPPAGRFRADTLAKKVPRRAWQKLSAGAGAKGHRFYDWAVIDIADPAPGSRQLLIRTPGTAGRCPAHHVAASGTSASSRRAGRSGRRAARRRRRGRAERTPGIPRSQR